MAIRGLTGVVLIVALLAWSINQRVQSVDWLAISSSSCGAGRISTCPQT